MSCENTCEISTRKTHQGPSVQNFQVRRGELVMQAPSAQHVPRFQTLGRKGGFSISHIVCANSLGTVSHPCQGMVRTFLRYKFQDASQWSSFQAGLSKDSSHRPDMLTLFCTVFKLVQPFQKAPWKYLSKLSMCMTQWFHS